MTALYNEIDPVACDVLRELIARGVIAPGVVDSRSIAELEPHDLADFTQVHLFAGAGCWSVAARAAGWSDERPIWSASCPCQPFSAAGKGAGIDDPRHLWPHVHRLVSASRPPVLVGEQVAGKAGRAWFDGVAADLERGSYACRSVDVAACAVNAPHQRQRLYWVAVADADSSGRGRWARDAERGAQQRAAAQRPDEVRAWDRAEWVSCGDGKRRRAEPDFRMLVDGLPGRADIWRLAGNAIVVPLATEVIAALIDVLG